MEISSDINEFIKNAESQKTVDKTKRDVAKFSEFLRSESVNESIENIQHKELDVLLARYFMSVKTLKGEEYEPMTLKGFQSSIQRYLLSKVVLIDIISDPAFSESQKTLKTKQLVFKRSGKGNRHNAVRSN